jgi:hypothetical protein
MSFSRSKNSSSHQKALPPEAPFVLDLFDEIEKAKLEYCVERNYERLPFNLDGGDIDLLIREKHFQTALAITSALANKHNAMVQLLQRNSGLTAIRCFGFDCEGKAWAVPIDLETDLRWRGIEFYPSKRVLKNASFESGIRRANSCDAALIAFLKELLYKKNVPYKYREELIQAYQENPQYLSGQLGKAFGRKGSRLLGLLPNHNIQNLKKVAKELCHALLIRRLLRSPLCVLRHKSIDFVIHCRRVLVRPGIMLVVLGSDGVGKSTLIERVRHEFDRLMHVAVKTQIRHWRPHLLPRLARLFGRKIVEEPTESLINPHAAPPSGTFGSILRLAYYTIDYLLGYLFLIYPVLVKYPTVCFFDRYYYDYFVDPTRWKVNAPKWAVKLFGCFVPRPDLIIILTADLSLIHQRKPELSLEELYQQAIIRRQLARKLKNVVWIDNSGDVEISANKMLQAVFEAFAGRTKHNRFCKSQKEESVLFERA